MVEKDEHVSAEPKSENATGVSGERMIRDWATGEWMPYSKWLDLEFGSSNPGRNLFFWLVMLGILILSDCVRNACR